MQLPKYTKKQKIQIIIYIILISIFLVYLLWNKYGSEFRTYQLQQQYIKQLETQNLNSNNSTVSCAAIKLKENCVCEDDRKWQITCFDKVIKIANKDIKVAVAQTLLEQEEGMMQFQSLEKDFGMLFVFSDSKLQTFWMKNTYLPLTMIFIDDSYQVVNVANAIPLDLSGVSSLRPAKYVLEIQQDLQKELNVEVGDKLINSIN